MNTHRIKKTSLLLLALSIFPLSGTALAKEKLKIFILAGQSNTVGHANSHTIATLYQSGSDRDNELAKMVFKKDSGLSAKVLMDQLAHAQKIDELTGGISNDKIKKMKDGPEKIALEAKVKKLKKVHETYKKKVSESVVISDRVYINSIADGNRRSGKLSFGYGGNKNKIGPELGFGLSIAKKVKGPILLIKTSWGGKSINYDFRPPSAGEYPLNEKQKNGGKAEQIKMNAGLFWRKMQESIRNVLANLKDNHPAYDPKVGHEISGFVWFQGFNDQFSPEFRNNYKDVMIHFINDFRSEYKVPSMPFVIGVLGTGRTKENVDKNAVSQGQRAAAKELGLKGNVLSVESYEDYSNFSHSVFTKGWPKVYHQWDTVGSDRPYHYLGSGAFFVRLGDSFANAMGKIIANKK